MSARAERSTELAVELGGDAVDELFARGRESSSRADADGDEVAFVRLSPSAGARMSIRQNPGAIFAVLRTWTRDRAGVWHETARAIGFGPAALGELERAVRTARERVEALLHAPTERRNHAAPTNEITTEDTSATEGYEP